MSEKKISLDVVLATYNEPEFTAVTLEGYSRQTDMDFNLLIADDGSTDQIKQIIDSFKNKINIEHFYQEDRGFRRAKILNKAAFNSDADYLIFSDNDCIPSKYFIQDHKKAAELGVFVSGRRVKCKKEFINHHLFHLNDYSKMPFDSMTWLLWNSCIKNIKHAEIAFRLPYWIHILWSKKTKRLSGANFGIWRSDFLQIGGFDESFETYGGEEVDLEKRLLQEKIAERKSLLGRGYVFHFYHSSRSKPKMYVLNSIKAG